MQHRSGIRKVHFRRYLAYSNAPWPALIACLALAALTAPATAQEGKSDGTEPPLARLGGGGAQSTVLPFGLRLSDTPFPLGEGGDALAAGGEVTLPEAIAEALRTNPQMASAAQQLAQVRAKLGQAQAGRRLSLTFNSTGSLSHANVYQPPPEHETFTTLQNAVVLPLPLGQKPKLAVGQAQQQLASAEAAYGSARLALAAQVATAFYDLLKRQAVYEIAEQTLAQSERELSDTQKRFRAGDVPELDTFQAQVPVGANRAVLAKAAGDIAVAKQTLNDLIGRPLDDPITLADSATDPAGTAIPSTIDEARTLALSRSLDIVAAGSAVAAAGLALKSARLYREPTFSIQAIDAHSTDKTGFSSQQTLQADVSLPLSDGGLGESQVREAQAALDQAKAQAQIARKTVLAAVSAAYVNAQSTRAQVAAAQAARDIAQLTYDKTVRGYQEGLFPLINVLNAQNALTQARLSYVQALYDSRSVNATLTAAITGSALAAPASPSAAPAAAAQTQAGPTTNAPSKKATP